MSGLIDIGWGPFFEAQQSAAERAELAPARVTEEVRGLYRLRAEAGEWLGELAGALRHQTLNKAGLPAVGDWVLVKERPGEGRATIRRVLSRRTKFSRLKAPRDQPKSMSADQQIVAANIDVVLLVTSLNRDFNIQRLERYLVVAWESGARPVVVLNKADLCDDPTPWVRDAEAAALGVPVLVTSATRGDGIGDLRRLVRESGTSALLGSSGVGKSTLINALLDEPRQHVAPIRESDARGRHSTTSRQLLVIPGGGVSSTRPACESCSFGTAATATNTPSPTSSLWDANAALPIAHTRKSLDVPFSRRPLRDA